ncbi:MAG: DUF4388 domain-containing protein [Deltaproteobacteria bacterium]|nr:DUF4388 domain-containing protein [Deltaproteobacteria bacterium]
MDRGTIVEARVVDNVGRVELQSGSESCQGRLIDAVDAFTLGQRVRLRLGIAGAETGGGRCDSDLVIQGMVVRAGEAGAPSLRSGCGTGAHFAFEVQRITRGLLWSEAQAPAAVEAAPIAPVDLGRATRPLVEVEVRGLMGELDLVYRDQVYRGQLLRVPEDLAVGQELHIRVVGGLAGVALSLREHTDILAKVVQVLSGGQHGGRARYRDGVRLALGIVRQAAGDVELPVVDAAQVEQLIHAALPTPPPPPAASAHERCEQTPSLRLRPRQEIVGEPSGIMGSLRQMPLSELLQSMQASRKTACVEINGSRHQGVGHVYMCDGELTAAFDGDCAGEEALRSMIRLESGTFRIRFGVAAPALNVKRSLTHILLDAMRLLDEERRDQQRLGRSIDADGAIEIDSADIEEIAEVTPVAVPQPLPACGAGAASSSGEPAAVFRVTRRAVFADFFNEAHQADRETSQPSRVN